MKKEIGKIGGEGGIRTHEPGFARLPAFEAGSFNRSDTSPRRSGHSNTQTESDKRTAEGAEDTEDAEPFPKRISDESA